MSSRLVPPLLAAAAVVFACGTLPRPELRLGGPKAPEVDIGHDDARPRKAHRGDSAAIDASLAVTQSTEGVRFALSVANGSKRRLELDFADGHTRDFAVVDAAGREVWNSSRGRLYTQAVQTKLLSAGDTVTYRERWSRATPGRYTVIAVLRSGNFPVTRRAEFVVAPGAGAEAAVVATK